MLTKKPWLNLSCDLRTKIVPSAYISVAWGCWNVKMPVTDIVNLLSFFECLTLLNNSSSLYIPAFTVSTCDGFHYHWLSTYPCMQFCWACQKAQQVVCCLHSEITRCWDVKYLIFVMNGLFLHWWCGQTMPDHFDACTC